MIGQHVATQSAKENGNNTTVPRQDVTRQVVERLQRIYLQEIPEEVRRRAREIILDTLGVTVGGMTMPAARLALEHVTDLGGRRRCHVLGSHLMAPAPLAAFVNGVSSHAMDYDDSNFQLLGHSSGATLATLLALAEERRTPGRALVEAFIASFEAILPIAYGLMPQHYRMGWHHVGTLTTFRAAAAGAKLLGLNAECSAHALGIAGSLAGGLRANTGTYTKAMHAGNAAYNGVTAALLAERGFTASNTIFEQDLGFCLAANGAAGVFWEPMQRAFEEQDAKWGLLDPGVVLKMHPCATAIQPAIQLVIQLVRDHDLRPEQVEQVRYGYNPNAPRCSYFDDPQTTTEAMYSMTHVVAIALVYRRAGIDEFGEQALRDPVVADLRSRVHTYPDSELASYTAVPDVPATHITILLKDGRTFEGIRRRPKGYPGGEPATREDMEGKFVDCVTQAIPRSRAEAAVDLVGRLETLSSVDPLVRVLRAPRARTGTH